MTMPAVNTSDRPFALPNRELISTVVDLPYPVSANAMYARSKHGVRRSDAYLRWIKEAGDQGLLQKIGRMPSIDGPFRAELLLRDGRKADCDNAIKVVLDLAQRWNLIANDKYCREINIKFVASHQAPIGARLTLVELA